MKILILIGQVCCLIAITCCLLHAEAPEYADRPTPRPDDLGEADPTELLRSEGTDYEARVQELWSELFETPTGLLRSGSNAPKTAEEWSDYFNNFGPLSDEGQLCRCPTPSHGFFYANAPDPIEAPIVPFVVQQDNMKMKAYVNSWLNSGLANRFSAYSYRNVSEIIFTTIESPSFYDSENNVIYISISDYNNYGIIVLDHELTYASIFMAHENGLITDYEFSRMLEIPFDRFPEYTGYAGSIRGWLHLQYGVGAGKTFAIGQQYRHLKEMLPTLGSTHRMHANKYIADVEGNVLVSRTLDRKAVHLISTNASAASINRFLGEFMTDGTDVRRRIRWIRNKLPEVGTLTLRNELFYTMEFNWINN